MKCVAKATMTASHKRVGRAPDRRAVTASRLLRGIPCDPPPPGVMLVQGKPEPYCRAKSELRRGASSGMPQLVLVL